jgi:hypothetical protein
MGSEEAIRRTLDALRSNGMDAMVVADREAARREILARVPEGAEILDASSETLAEVGVVQALRERGRFSNVRSLYEHIADHAERAQARRKASTPEYVVGSVQAVTEHGEILCASQGGSQLAPYVYGAARVLWIVGSQKIVPDITAGLRRIYEIALPLEEARMRRVTGGKFGSGVNKILIVNKEPVQGRVFVLIVKEALGY